MKKQQSISLRKARKLLYSTYNTYKRKKNTLSSAERTRFEYLLQSLQIAIEKKDKKTVTHIVQTLNELSSESLKKSFVEQFVDLIVALVFALAIAIAIRQMWFEFYTIPTGSMRPTFKEKDFLVVSKIPYGINTLTRTSHFYFDSSLVKRGDIVVFSADKLDTSSPDTKYFYVIPGKKQFIKRLIAKPGDTIYFYGGHLYGIDTSGNEITDYRNEQWFENIEHIPFIRFDGKVSTQSSPTLQGIFAPVVLYQMNDPVGKMSMTPNGKLFGEVLSSKNSSFPRTSEIQDYYNLWGFRNYAMARIVTKNQVLDFSNEKPENISDADLYLELSHHPDIHHPIVLRDEYGRLRPTLATSSSFIPLDEEHVQMIFKSLYTSRFYVKNEIAYPYSFDKNNNLASEYFPKLKNVPNGCYEFQNGVAYEILWGGITKKLPQEHPLYYYDASRTQLLYNLGIEWYTVYNPQKAHQNFIPSRYAYFRNHALYLLGNALFKKNDPVLVKFMHNEYQKQSASSARNTPYVPFEDLGPPIKKNNEIDKDFIRKYGLTIPDKMYLVLGDNHAQSADSRDFGFVPRENIRGIATAIFWPPGPRIGRPPQPHHPWITFPHVMVWSLFIAISCSTYIIIRKKRAKKLKF